MLNNEAKVDPLEVLNNEYIPSTTVHNSVLIKFEPGKTLNINATLDNLQCKKLIEIL